GSERGITARAGLLRRRLAVDGRARCGEWTGGAGRRPVVPSALDALRARRVGRVGRVDGTGRTGRGPAGARRPQGKTAHELTSYAVAKMSNAVDAATSQREGRPR